MNNIFTASRLVLSLLSVLAAQPQSPAPLKDILNDALAFSLSQSIEMARSLHSQTGLLPKTADRFGNLETCTPAWWTSGFFPGTLWYLYEYSGRDSVKMLAKEFTLRIQDQQYNTSTHDVGFMINCSYGNGFRITGDTSYRNVLRTASFSQLKRFHPFIGVIRSWNTDKNNRQWQYAVIIDNMMNLELLMKAAKEFNNPAFSSAAVSHANVTMKNHFRSDYSTVHVVSYDTVSGLPHAKQTAQGYSDGSAWARGQAWGLYGFTMMYRFTNDTSYLSLAKHIADFIIYHPRLPEDKIPYWDFDAPNIPDTYRDASSGAIICSALIELSGFVPAVTSKEYLAVAEKQIRTLNTSQYRNALGNNAHFILKHGVGNMPNNTEIDQSLSYADYYFVEALLRMKRVKGW